jgi:hypothetical protein
MPIKLRICFAIDIRAFSRNVWRLRDLPNMPTPTAGNGEEVRESLETP